MKFGGRTYSKPNMIFLLVTFIAMCWCSESSQPYVIQSDEIATVIGKYFSYKLPAETAMHSGYTFKLYASGGGTLPSWLSFDEARNILLGIPSHHDKGRHDIMLDIISDETNKTVSVNNWLSINVVQYDEDLDHYNALKTALPDQDTQNRSQTLFDCPGHMPVLVATLVFDLSVRKLSGAKRVELLRKVSNWLDIDVEKLRFLPGKGDKSAFNLKDVIFLTAGPGSVNDPQERGVSVSWKIGCGDSVAGIRPVSLLKLASEKEVFKKYLGSRVSGWHVTHGMLRHRQVVRVRRQAPAGNTPMLASAFVPPTISVLNRAGGVVGTPTIAASPSFITMSPTAMRVSPSPMQVSPSPTQIASSPVMTRGPSTTLIPQGNNQPNLTNPIGNLTIEVNVPFRFPVPPATFTDIEDGETPFLRLDFYDERAYPFPGDFWLKLSKTTQTFHGTPTKTGQVTIMLVVTDSGNLKTSDYITVNIVAKNNPPKVINHIDLITLYVGQPIKFHVPHDTFHDIEDDHARHLNLSLTTIDDEPLPSWISFDVKAQTIYALPLEGQIGKPEFILAATDSNGKMARDAFEIHVLPLAIQPNNKFGLVLDAPFEKFEKSVELRVKLFIRIGEYFGSYFNVTYKDLRVRSYKQGSVVVEWSFANITDTEEAEMYKEKYVIGDSGEPVQQFATDIKNNCPIKKTCPVEKVYVDIHDPDKSTPSDPNIVARAGDKGGGTWWKYTIIPAFVVAAIVFIIGLIVIICIRCRRKTKMNKNDKVVFLYRKKPAVFREEYPMKEVYGDQPLITPSEKPPLPPPAYPRSSTPTDDPSAALLSDSSPSYQPPSFDNGPEQGSNARSAVPSYRLPPPYVAP